MWPTTPALAQNPATVDWSYALVNPLIFAAGLDLVTLGPPENDGAARCGRPAGRAARFTIGCQAPSG